MQTALKQHILVISQCFYPEQFRINDICTEWVKSGHKVTVVTAIPNYPQGKFYKGYGYFKKRTEKYNGIDIIRLPIIPREQNVVTLSLNYLSFVVSGFFWSKVTKLRADKVFIYESSPMTQALVGVWYAKRRKIPCFIYVTDLWPENVKYAGGINNRYILNAIGLSVDYIYKNCSRIFVSSRSFIKAISARGVPEDKPEFWPYYAEEFYTPRDRRNVNVEEIPIDGTFNIIFAGNIGAAQGLGILPRTASELRRRGVNVRFNIVGDGRYLPELKRGVHKEKVGEMFNFVKMQPAERIPDFMSVCDAALISLAGNEIFAMTIPSKLQSAMACGIPLIISADGEIQKICEESGAGVYCNAGDPNSLAEKIIELLSQSPERLSQMGKNARKYFLENYEKKMLLKKMDAFIFG
ncbi:MAG: glycosyltransferase family 4 protein [Synergistes sp.]|nr:glycosyltransferase family 4 protein [Synergistes sp.]